MNMNIKKQGCFLFYNRLGGFLRAYSKENKFCWPGFTNEANMNKVSYMNKNFLCEWNCYMNKFSCMNRISYVNKISYMNKNFLHEWISYMNKFSYMNKISSWITWIKFLIWIHLAYMNKKCVHEYCYIWSTIKVHIFESFNFAVEFSTVNPSDT